MTTTDVRAALEAQFDSAGAVGFVHAQEIAGSRALGYRSDELVVTLERTALVGDCRELLGSFAEDTCLELASEERFADVDPERLRAWRSLDPERTTRTTPEEVTRLLALVWRDQAGSPQACAEVRRIMAMQVWPHRLTSGFPDGVTLAAKTGTLPGIRNEAGVVTYPDGSQYAVAVFTRADSYVDRRPEVDRVIGSAAFTAVEALRGSA